MKKHLLLAIAALLALGASAQLKRSEMPRKAIEPRAIEAPDMGNLEQSAQVNNAPALRVPKRAGLIEAGYYRPAGAFYGDYKVEEGVYTATYYAPYLFITPYEDYTFRGFAVDATDEAVYRWNVQQWDSDLGGRAWTEIEGQDLTVNYSFESDSVPILSVDQPGASDTYYLRGHKMEGSSSNPTIAATYSSWVAAIPVIEDTWEYNILQSSHYFGGGGRNGDHYYNRTYYSGTTAWGANEKGWWFGKNAGSVNGVASVFEAPEHPYLLKHVDVYVTALNVKGEVELTCKVYKLDGVQDYNDSAAVRMDLVPGELICYGKCKFDSLSAVQAGNMLEFTLMGEEDGLEYETTPTIDCPIMITLEDYNNDEYSNLREFSLLVSTEMVDEGFGEQAYLKYTELDSEGNVADVYWKGLNNFFKSGELKSGFTIFIDADHPYLTFNYVNEDGEYTFPAEGGTLEKFGQEGIEFFSYYPSVDEGWTLTCDDEDVPEWLNIELTDEEEAGEFSGVVVAQVTADPLPENVAYREAKVKFEFPGNYKYYTFKQGTPSVGIPGDVNGDGEVNISDVNAAIDLIFSSGYTEAADLNGDGEVNISDVNDIINKILGGN